MLNSSILKKPRIAERKTLTHAYHLPEKTQMYFQQSMSEINLDVKNLTNENKVIKPDETCLLRSQELNILIQLPLHRTISK
jgi:hypothetical protein